MKTADSSDDVDSRQILLTGNIDSAFSDSDAVRRLPCRIVTDIPAAIETAATGQFKAIAVVMSGSSAALSTTLKALRKANSDAKIILLSQMYEEPRAMRLVGSRVNGAGLADDYLICPMHFSYLLSCVSHLVHPGIGPVDKAVETKLKALEALATTDELTGLKNRRYIWEFSRQIIERAKEEKGQVTLLVFDIDDFKHYNDVYGHSAGDEILRQAGLLMQRCCRGHDVVGRVGGDEFTVIFWDDPQRKAAGSTDERRLSTTDHPKEVIFIAKRFRRQLQKAELPLLGPEGKGVLAISGGLASFPRDGSTIQRLFQQADKALLEAKRSGKNRIYLVGRPEGDIADIE
jgi:diguanylate cyclase (GGDEF)-like protein